jgi:Fe/S biogenesis protein NfuA
MITISDNGKKTLAEYVAEAGEECIGVRIRAVKVGKYTFRYQIHLVRERDTSDDDVRSDFEGCAVILDPQTAEWMEGAEIDYMTMESGAGFQIENPAATPTWEEPICQKVQEVIDTKVTPVVGSHGGWVELDRVDGDTAYVHLGGGCQGCASATFTLKQGIESVITTEVAEIDHVVDETDHESGSQPYYSS